MLLVDGGGCATTLLAGRRGENSCTITLLAGSVGDWPHWLDLNATCAAGKIRGRLKNLIEGLNNNYEHKFN
jgi:hypothetical protein